MRSLIILLLLLSPGVALAQRLGEAPLSDRRVAYVIDATLDPETHTIAGHERLLWRNPGKVPVGELQFHLYLNAFKDPQSTFMRESGGEHRGFTLEGDDRWGHVDVTALRVVDGSGAGADLTAGLHFIQPDDGNADDQTVAAVTLPTPVAPGDTLTLEIDFTSVLPKIFARTGWERKPDGSLFFMAGQWFPKLGVYEIPGQRYVSADAPRGQWNTHQFHANSEFYADFGTFDVSLTVPADYVVGASGLRVDETQQGDTRTVTYRAEDVHDFAWTASPTFVEYEDTWRHVNIRLLLQPEHDGQAERHFTAVENALERFTSWLGEYPYTTLTLVDGIGGSNGMEYPTLITCGTYYMEPEWTRFTELVTVHEFGHQYFYGMLASNEFEEPWLDEGFNSYFEMRIMDDAYGAGSAIDFPGMRISDSAFQRLGYTKSRPSRGVVYRYAWDHPFSSDYGKVSYAKPATLLMTLQGYLGDDVMENVFRTYFERWRFRHPTTRDFIDVAEEVSGQDLGWFFDQFVYGSATVDYAVDAINTSGSDEDGLSSTVLLHRLRDGIFPETLRVRFDDGHTEDATWDGRDEWKPFTFDGRVVEAFLDPDNVVRLDVDRLNDRKLTDEDNLLARKEQLKVSVWLQQVLTLLAGLL